MSVITKEIRKDGDLTSPDGGVTLSDSGGAYGVKRNDTDAVVVADDTAMTEVSEGVFQYTFDDPAEGLVYTVAFEIAEGSQVIRFSELFDGPADSSSILSIAYEDLMLEVAAFLGYGAAIENWSVDEDTELDRYVQAGIRQFYYPPAVEGVEAGYEWSFLKPTTTLETASRYTTGSLAVVTGTCTLSDGTWPVWAATHGMLVIDDTEYAITTRDSDTELTVVGDDISADEDDWYLSHVGRQDLPDDLARVVGDFYYEAGEHKASIPQVSESAIKAALSRTSDESHPQMCTVRHKAQVTDEEQRLEVVWYPIPNAAYTLGYTYEAYSGKLSLGNEYPLGGMKYGELITESCLAIAEQRANDERGIHTVAFERLLVTGVAQDRKHGATYYGPMSPGAGDTLPRHHAAGVDYPITYKGSTW